MRMLRLPSGGLDTRLLCGCRWVQLPACSLKGGAVRGPLGPVLRSGPSCLAYLPTYLPTWLPTHLLPIDLLPTYLPTYLPTHLVPTYLPTCASLWGLPTSRTYRPTY